MSTVTNRDPYVDADPATPVPPRRPRPQTDPPPARTISTAQSQLDAAAGVSWYVEYWLKNVRAGRFLGGPYTTREGAVAYANQLMEHTEHEHEVCRVSIVAMIGGVS